MNKKKLIREFERTINLGKARAFANISLERPLTEQEFLQYKKIMGALI